MNSQESYQGAYSPQLREALDSIKEAVQGERKDELFYDYLIEMAPSIEDKEIITSIRDDERKHNRFFRTIFRDFMKAEITSMGSSFERPRSYVEGIRSALFGELQAVEKYRAIRRALPRGQYRDMLFEIITDEINHAIKYNYLISLNMMDRMPMNRNQELDRTNFTPDDWVRYITPLVNRALEEAKEGINPEHLYQEFILSGVLVGLGMTPQDAIIQVEKWENTGVSKLLAESKMAKRLGR